VIVAYPAPAPRKALARTASRAKFRCPGARPPYRDRMQTHRTLISSGSDFEAAVGYSRAVRVGPHVAVAGTTGAGPADDIAAQARDALRRIEIALDQAGASLTDVVRTRMYVTDISRWREVAAVHAEVFGDIRPVATMVEVTALIAPELLVEIEADAYVSTGGKDPSGDGR
jgi:enamine deaminase RidA (YjgF/YER057c/UK114 family)